MSETDDRDRVVESHKMGYWICKRHREAIKNGAEGEA